MKQITLIALSICVLSLCSSAQTFSNLKGSALEERLIGYSYKADTFDFDTVHFYYKNAGVGSVLNNDRFLPIVNFSFSDVLIPDYPKHSFIRSLPPTILFDSAYRKYNGPFRYDTTESVFIKSYASNTTTTTEHRSEYNASSPVITTYKTTFSYDMAGNRLSMKQDINGSQRKEAYYKYNAAGQVTIDSFLEILTSTPANSLNFGYEYNSAGDLASITLFNWPNTTPMPFKRIQWTYNQNRQPIQCLTQNMASNWENDRKDSFSYSGNHLIHRSSYINWVANGNNWGLALQETYFRNAAGLTDSVIYSRSNSILNKRVYTYTNQEHCSKIEIFEYDSAAGYAVTPIIVWNFYYQPFTPSSITPDGTPAGDYIIYPNPVKSLLNIRCKNERGFNVLLYDMAGKMIRRETTYRSSLQFNTSALESGYYLLQISDGKNSRCHTFYKE